jgi:hypothetical protein
VELFGNIADVHDGHVPSLAHSLDAYRHADNASSATYVSVGV